MRIATIAALSSVLVVLPACEEPAPSPASGPEVSIEPQIPVLPFDHPPIVGTGGGNATGGGAGTGGGSDATGGGGVGGGVGGGAGTLSSSAGNQRLTISQLTQSMLVVLGGKSWMVGAKSGFTVRAATLGQPDYLGVVEENLEASPVYQKFMLDAAISGCTAAADGDAALAANQRVLMRLVGLTDTVASNLTAVNQNLRYLKLRFHGVKVASNDTASLDALRIVFSSAVSGAAGAANPTAAHVKEGWRAVCVALMTAPEYHLY